MRRRVARGVAMATTSVLLLGGCGFSIYDVPLPGGADVGDDSYAVKIQFRDVIDLVPQSSVKVDDVSVGKVESVKLKGFTAEVVIRLRGDVRLPDNTEAKLRQTSLLGEKFVSLSPQSGEPPRGRLEDGETIPLERSGRNPEVEEVLAALSLLLNGGGIDRLKTITTEFNNVLSGNEENVKHLLGELETLMAQVDRHKEDIVGTIEAVNRLSKSVKAQTTAITSALDRMPAALDSLDSQRRHLVKMLDALGRLSDVGVRVIEASEEHTLNALQSLNPILTQLAAAGDALPKSLQILLSYPFVDAAVGTTVAEARNVHIGDYQNLDAKLDIDVTNPPTIPGLPPPLEDIQKQLNDLSGLGGNSEQPGLPPSVGGQDGGGGQTGESGNGCTLIVLSCRPAPGFAATSELDWSAYDRDVAVLLLQGVRTR